MNIYKKIQKKMRKNFESIRFAEDERYIDEMRLNHLLSLFDLPERSDDKRTKGGKLRRDIINLYYKHKSILQIK